MRRRRDVPARFGEDREGDVAEDPRDPRRTRREPSQDMTQDSRRHRFLNAARRFCTSLLSCRCVTDCRRSSSTDHRSASATQEEPEKRREETKDEPKEKTDEEPEETRDEPKEKTDEEPKKTDEELEGTDEEPEETEEEPKETDEEPEETRDEPKEKTDEEPKKTDEEPKKTDEESEGTDEEPEETEEEPKETDEEPERTDEEPEWTDEEPEWTDEEPEWTDEEPEVTDEEPQETVEEPEWTDEEPEGTVEEPQETVEEPEWTDEEPEWTDEEPEGTVEEPEGTVEEPEETVEEPEVTDEEPKKTDVEPEWTDEEPEGTNEDPSLPEERAAFFRCLEDDYIRMFLASDSCCKISDKYLLAVVLTYFRRAGLRTEEYNIYFFEALFLANQFEEDEEFRREIYPWALGRSWMKKKTRFLYLRNYLLERMGFRAWVARATCDLIMAQDPEHWAWKRERRGHHTWAIHWIRRTERGEYTLNGPWRIPPPCSLCTIDVHPCAAEENVQCQTDTEEEPGAAVSHTCSLCGCQDGDCCCV